MPVHSEAETERYYVNRWYPSWIRYPHEERYRWVGRHTVGCRVLDAACGTGYGSAMLSEAGAAEVEGLDLSTAGVAEATALYERPGLTFRQGSVLALTNGDASFDVVVSFETVEHVGDDVAYVKEMRRVLKPGGLFFCSTPNRKMTNPGMAIEDRPYNPFHVREYSSGEFVSLLRSAFDDVQLLGQKTWSQSYCASLAWLSSTFAPIVAVRAHQIRKALNSPRDKPQYYLPTEFDGRYEPEGLIARCS